MLYGISAYLLLTAIAIPVFILGWMRQEKTKDAGIVDVLWTLFTGWGGVAIIAFGPGDFQQRLPVLLMVSLWCIRVSHYVLQRMRDDGHEDGRYLMLREKWGSRAPKLFFGFFQLQVGFVLMFIIPFVFIAVAPLNTTLLWIGFIVWLVGNTLAMLADRQLAAWRRNPANKGRTCRHGLWQWSRHPNYFFEWLHWCSYAIIALAAPYGVVAWLTPAILLFLLLKVTGIPYAEKQALRSRGDDYRAYQAEVSPFIPLPPSKRAGSLPTDGSVVRSTP